MTATATATPDLALPRELAQHPAVVAAAELANTLLAPQAETVDASRVPRSHLDAIAAAGLLGVSAPVGLGGGGHPAAVARAVTEVLAGACGATWFVATQHAMPLGVVAASDNPALAGTARDLASGRRLAGVAVAHLRRPGSPAVTARRDGDGWLLDGSVGWMTSWGIADLFLLGARTDDDRVLLALLESREQPGLIAGEPMRLVAMQASSTTSLTLDALRVPDYAVADLSDAGDYLAADAVRTANVTPAVFGLLRAIVERLAALTEDSGLEDGARLALALGRHGAQLRARAFLLLDDVPPSERLDERLALRAEALELLQHAAAALVSAGAGASMASGHPHQRLAREALFHLVQAQTRPVREATLRRFADTAQARSHA